MLVYTTEGLCVSFQCIKSKLYGYRAVMKSAMVSCNMLNSEWWQKPFVDFKIAAVAAVAYT